MNPLLTLSGTRLAALIRAREITSLEAVDVHIDRIKRVNPVINAVVRDRFELAREEARQADRAVQESAPLPPFHGVPCTIKESFALRGMPQSAGLPARRDFVSSQDAVTVARLRRAGAIPLGVTNLSELCMWMESANRLYGRTNNPYDPRRIAGGSSGGEGAIVGAGGAPFGLGSDIGGSIRMPAFFGGVFGHKPTGGLVPPDGQFPLPVGPALRYICAGPLCRRAEDLFPLLSILAGTSGQDPATVDLKDLSVVSIESNGRTRVSEELRDAQRRVLQALGTLGARTRTAELPLLRPSLEIWSALMHAAGGPSFSELLGEGTPVRAGRELLRWALGRSPHTLPALGLALLEKVPAWMPKQAHRFIAMGGELRAEMGRLLGERGVLLYPSYPCVAPRHHQPLLPPFRWAYTAILNILEMPATQVPLGLNARGLPLGVQVASLPGNDHLTLAVALRLEREFGGWIPPPPPPDRR